MVIDARAVHESMQKYLRGMEEVTRSNGFNLTPEAKAEIKDWIDASRRRVEKLKAEGAHG